MEIAETIGSVLGVVLGMIIVAGVLWAPMAMISSAMGKPLTRAQTIYILIVGMLIAGLCALFVSAR